MQSLLLQLRLTLLLHFRNRIALLYSYLFPTIFLIAFWVLYRYEDPPIARHLGELLTVTAMGGACFGLPTSMVAERERGVWRRYRLVPVKTAQLVATTLLGRYVLLLTAGLIQLLLALAIGMPVPEHPLDLFVVFTLVCFAFMGLGLVIAVLADTVPAVQALGQCIFLPMLIIGGVAVRLSRLPDWAQHLSLFFPGRYAVESIQATATGDGIDTVWFAVLALILIAIAGAVAGVKMFRWDAQQRFRAHGGKAWLGVALASWLFVGVLAEATGRVAVGGVGAATAGDGADVTLAAIVRSDETDSSISTVPVDSTSPSTDSVGIAVVDTVSGPSADSSSNEGTVPTVDSPTVAPPPRPQTPREPWQAVTMEEIERNINFASVPIDEDVVTPVATSDESITPEYLALLNCMRGQFPAWGPALAADPVQRVRALLLVPATTDYIQMEEERWIPLAVFERIQQILPRDDLVKILYWIATHPNEGDDYPIRQLRGLCLDTGGPDDGLQEIRERTAIYAVKLLGRITGKIVPR